MIDIVLDDDEKWVEHLRAWTVISASHPETHLHRVADSFTPRLEVAMRLAFALGRKAIGRKALDRSKDAERAVKAIRTSLEDTLPKALRRVYVAGGEAAAGMLRTAGDFDESKHPRDEGGKFTDVGPGTGYSAVRSSASDDPAEWKKLTAEYRQARGGLNKQKIWKGKEVNYYPSKEDGEPSVLRVVDEGKVVGILEFQPHSNEEAGELEAVVQVHPDYRRQGMATMLYDRAEELTGERFEPSGLQTERAKAFWQARKGLRTASGFDPDQPRDERGRWVYHGTSTASLASIRERGLTPNEHGNPLNFHQVEESAQDYAGKEGTLLRVRASDLPEDATHDPLTKRAWTLTAVPSDKIEVKQGEEWVPLGGSSAPSFNMPEDFTLEDAQYDVGTKYPLDSMVVASVDLGLLSSEYKNDYRVREMAAAIEKGAKLPALTLELREDGTLNILDGRTRVAALRELGITGRVPAVVRLFDKGVEGSLPEGVAVDAKRTESLRSGKRRQLRTAKRDPRRGPFRMAFDVASPEAIAWADRHAGELIDGITETSREAISNAVAEALEEGDLQALYDEILEAVGSEERAELIAKTEVMTAANEGQREAWRQAVDNGLLTGDEERTWIATTGGTDESVCDVCKELDGTFADLDGEYPEPGGAGPPAHPRCRCTEGLA